MKFCGFLLKAKLHFDQSILIVSWEGYVTILLVITSDAEPEWVPQLLRMCQYFSKYSTHCRAGSAISIVAW